MGSDFVLEARFCVWLPATLATLNGARRQPFWVHYNRPHLTSATHPTPSLYYPRGPRSSGPFDPTPSTPRNLPRWASNMCPSSDHSVNPERHPTGAIFSALRPPAPALRNASNPITIPLTWLEHFQFFWPLFFPFFPNLTKNGVQKRPRGKV